MTGKRKARLPEARKLEATVATESHSPEKKQALSNVIKTAIHCEADMKAAKETSEEKKSEARVTRTCQFTGLCCLCVIVRACRV